MKVSTPAAIAAEVIQALELWLLAPLLPSLPLLNLRHDLLVLFSTFAELFGDLRGIAVSKVKAREENNAPMYPLCERQTQSQSDSAPASNLGLVLSTS